MVATLRDLVIVALGAMGIITLLVILVLTVMVYSKLSPILDSVRKTMGNIQGTSSLVSDVVVKPVIRTASFAAGARKAVAFVLGLSRKKGGKDGRGKK